MSRHTLRNIACQALSRHLCRGPQVRTEHPDDLRRFRRGCQAGVWERLLTAVADAHADLSRVHLDSSHVRDYVRTVGAAGGLEAQALGRSRGGYGTQRHALVDAAGQLLRAPDPGPGRQHAPGPTTAGGTASRLRASRRRPPATWAS